MRAASYYLRFCSSISRRFPALVKFAKRRIEQSENGKTDVPLQLPSIVERMLGGEGRRGGGKVPKPSFRERTENHLAFVNLPLTAEEVLASAMLAGVVVAVACCLAVIGAVHALGLGVIPYVLPIAFIAPLASYSILLGYPEICARRVRIKSLASAPEAITYMAMSLKLTPSLNKAVEFAAENADEPLSGRLRDVLWDIYTRRKESVEDSFMSFANEWGEGNEDLKRSLYGLLSAAGEGTKEGLDRGLERAQDAARSGAKRRMEEFIRSLKMPSTAFFALCVLLPLIIGSTMPVLGLGSIGTPSAQIVSSAATSWNAAQMVVLLDIIFPLTAFAYSLWLLGKRPGTTCPPKPVVPFNGDSRRRWFIASCVIAASPIPLILLSQNILGPILALWCVVLGLSAYLILNTMEQHRKRREMRTLELQIPDALFVIGSKIGEGLPVEQALARASESLKGLKIAVFLDSIRFSLQLQRRGLEETLFGRGGLLENHPSRLIRVSLRMVVNLSRKDPAAAGKAIVDFSHYLRDLQEVEKDIRAKLGEIVDAMKSTATLFAPLVLGITAALYALLAKSFSDLGPLPMSPHLFVAALGVYLVVMVPVIMNFSVGLETGGDRSELAAVLGKAWPMSLAFFTIAAAVALIGLGA